MPRRDPRTGRYVKSKRRTKAKTTRKRTTRKRRRR